MRLCDIHPSFDLLSMKFELCTHIIYEGARILYERKGLKKEDGFRLVVRQRKTQRKVKRNKRTKRDRMLNQLHELKRADQELWLSINLHFTNKPALNALIEEMIANDEKRQIFFNTSTNVAEQGGYSGIVVHRFIFKILCFSKTIYLLELISETYRSEQLLIAKSFR